jgi:predicted GNAT family acetyltransferase
MTNDRAQDPFSIVDAPESHRYELRDGDTVVGFARYREHPDRMIFTHTVVDSAYEGQGLGSRLARFVLEDAVARDRRIVPVCPFIAAYLARHHEFDAHVDQPDDEARGTA